MTQSKYSAKKVIVTEDGTLFEVEMLKKYNITDIVGIKFDSKMEAKYYSHLLDELSRGAVEDITLQPIFVLQEKPKIKYTADFKVVYADGSIEIVDVKGMQTTAFRLKLRMFKSVFPDTKLVLVTQKGRQWLKVPA